MEVVGITTIFLAASFRRPKTRILSAIHSPYRQLHLLWFLQGLWQYLRGDDESKPLKRKGLASAGAQSPAEKMIT